MAVVTNLEVINTIDDAQEAGDGSFSYTASGLYVYSNPNPLAGNYLAGGVRFQGVYIPRGASILYAYLDPYTFSENWDNPNVDIYGNYVGNAKGFDAEQSIIGRVRTPIGVPYVEEGIGVGYRGTSNPDISSIIQQIIDHPDWVPGNAMAFMLIPKTDQSKAWIINTYPTNPCRLYIEYEGGEPYGLISIGSSPEGASVRIDGSPTGAVTPCDVSVDAGTHEVTLELGGYIPWVQPVEVAPYQTVTISATLVPAPYELKTAGNTQKYGGTNIISNYARTNRIELLTEGAVVSFYAWFNVVSGPCRVRCGVYEHISDQQAGTLLVKSVELVLQSGFDGLVKFNVVGDVQNLPPGRYHLMVNSYGEGEVSIYRGAWTDESWVGIQSWWGSEDWPDPFGVDEEVYEQGAPMSLYIEYGQVGGAPPVNPRTGCMYWTVEEMEQMRAHASDELQAPLIEAITNWCNQRINDSFPSLPEIGWRPWFDFAAGVRQYVENMGFVYWFSGDERYAAAARRWVMAIPTIPDNALYPGQWQVTPMLGLAIAAGYDELHDYLSYEELQILRVEMVERVARQKPAYWGDRYPNNMCVLCAYGILGLAMGEDYPGSQEWVDYGIRQANGVFDRLVDGWVEGAGYAMYGMNTLAPFLDALRRRTGTDLIVPNSSILDKLAYYIIYMNYNGKFLSMEDSTWGQRWEGEVGSYLSWMYLCAREFNNGWAQTFADTFAKDYVWESYTWRDPEVIPEPIAELPRRRLLPGVGYLFYRSAWGPLEEGDNSLLVVFKCGHSAWHGHNDQNGFSIFKDQQLITDGPGYVTTYTQWDQTRCHNCIIVNGVGQAQEIGDIGTAPWNTKGIIEETELSPNFTYIRGDAAPTFIGWDGVLNQMYTTLVSAIGIDDATLTVPPGEADRLRFPASHWTTPSFYLKVDNEYIYCSGRDGDVCHIAGRGQYDSEVAPHPAEAPVGLYYIDLHSGDLSKDVRHMVIMENPDYLVVMDRVEAPEPGKIEYCLQGNGGSFVVNGDLITLNHGILLEVLVVEPSPFVTQLITDTRYTRYPSMRVSSEVKADRANFLTVLFPGTPLLSVSRVKQDNLLGAVVKVDDEHLDLHLFSTDDHPVSQWVELSGYYAPADGGSYMFSGTKVAVNFDIYAIMRLVKTAAPPTSGTLSVDSTPSGATVYVNGNLIGATPLSVELEPGTYQLLLRLERYADWSASVDIETGQTASVSAILQPAPKSPLDSWLALVMTIIDDWRPNTPWEGPPLPHYTTELSEGGEE